MGNESITNSELTKIKTQAMNYVLEYEKKQGRDAIDVSTKREHHGYDIISGSMKIEVKGRSNDEAHHVLFNQYNIEAIEKASDDDYRLYIVTISKNGPKLIILKKKDVLSRKKERRQWDITIRKSDRSGAIHLL